MTTVVYRDGIVAADSRTNNSGWLNPGAAVKLERRDILVVAKIGDMAACAAILKWIDQPEGQQPTGDCTVVAFSRDEVRVYSDGGSFFEYGPFLAWGSGSPVALGALYAGCSAEEAVRIACKVDPWSGEPIMTMRIDNGP